MKILTASQMAAVDRKSAEFYSIPSMLLMENAGRSVAQEIIKACPELVRKRIYVFCGKGNNGGDGLVVARHLMMAGFKPEIFLHFDPSLYRGDAQLNWNIVHAMGLPVRILPEGESSEPIMKSLPAPDIIVDALLGTGLTKALSGDLLSTVRWINSQTDKAFIAAVDIPSGLFADAPELPGEAIHAHLTVTFTALKPALVFPPAADLAGKVIVTPIGSPDALLDVPEHLLELIDCEIVRRSLAPRARDAHKGDFGHVHIVAGSRGKSGAALMSGLAALRSGAGLVTLWLPLSLQSDIVGKIPELMTESLPETIDGTAAFEGFESLARVFPHASVLVIGPGLTTHESTKRLVRQLVKTSTVPVVLDADGLNAFAGEPESLRNLPGQPVVITPHPGEMARLLGRSIQDIQSHRMESALFCAQQYGCHTILKGYQTIIASPGGRVMVNRTGNPGMATGGSGDILAGMTGRFVAGWCRKRHQLPADALMDYLAAAVYLHGLAADLASEEKGVEALIATDLLPYLPQAFKRISNS